MAAMGRALHRDAVPSHIFDDWLAADLAGPDGRNYFSGTVVGMPDVQRLATAVVT